MSDYRLELDIEHGEDRSYIVHRPSGRRYEINSFDMKLRERSYIYQDVLHHFMPNYDWDLYLGLRELPPAPEPPKKQTYAQRMGLRRPK